MTETYPTTEQITAANIVQLCYWTRFLPSPGMGAIGQPFFEDVMQKEAAKMSLILARRTELGGMTPAISKAIGWE